MKVMGGEVIFQDVHYSSFHKKLVVFFLFFMFSRVFFSFCQSLLLPPPLPSHLPFSSLIFDKKKTEPQIINHVYKDNVFSKKTKKCKIFLLKPTDQLT